MLPKVTVPADSSEETMATVYSLTVTTISYPTTTSSVTVRTAGTGSPSHSHPLKE